MNQKIIFTGNFWSFFGFSILLIIGSVLTLGLLLPYYLYWQFKYFVNNLEIEAPKPVQN
jgi:uncharacterized membrane protein YjgN (DUF898 family)